MQEGYVLRTAHSKLIGYWNTDLGGVNEVVHIWEYGVFLKCGLINLHVYTCIIIVMQAPLPLPVKSLGLRLCSIVV